MGIDFPSSLSASAGQKFTYSGQEYEFNGTAWKKVRNKVTSFNGATGAIVGVSSVNGLTGSVTLKPSGFEFEIISTSLSVVDDTIPSNGGIRLVRDYLGATQITFNRFDKQGNDLAFPQINLQNNGGTIVGISEDGEKFFHIVSPDRDTRTGHSFTIQSNTVTPGKLKFQDSTNIPNDGSPDTGLIAMDNFSVGDKIFVQFIPNIAPATTVNGVSGPIVLASTLELGGPSGATLDINVDNLAVVRSFNGATGAIDTTSLVLPVTGLSASGGITLSGDISIAGDIISQDNNLAVRGPGGSEILMSFLGSQTIINNSAVDQDIRIKGVGDAQLLFTDAGNARVGIGTQTPTEKLDVNGTIKALGISGPSGITFSNGEVIRNNPDGSIQIIPSDEGGNHYGIEIDATEWGFGPTITAIEEDGTQSSASIRFDSDLVMGIDADGTSSRLQFSTNGDRAFQKLDHNDGTVMFGVNDNNGHFAVGRKAELNNANRSMSTSDKTALGMTNPQFLVYSADGTDANDYVRIEHDQTDANIFSGNGKINLNPAGGVVGISGGLEITGSHGFTFRGSGVAITAEGDGTNIIGLYATNGLEVVSGYTQDNINFYQIYEPIPGFKIAINRVKLASPAGEFLDVNENIVQIGDLDGNVSATEIKINPASSGTIEMKTGGTTRETFDSTYRRNTDVATFTISASSAITTGKKTDSLYRIPYDATLTNVDVKVSDTGGFTAGAFIAGGDFGDPAVGSLTGATLGVAGLTGSSNSFNITTVTGGNFLFFDVINNDSGSTQAQMFVTFESR